MSEHQTIYKPKILILGINAPYNKTKDINYYFEEFKNLIKTNKIEYNESLFIKLREIDPAFFLTKGKLEQLKKLCEEKKIEDIIVSDPLSNQQIRNLEEYLNCQIHDRTDLILEIFEKSAHSAEGKAQVQIAMLEYKKARLAGKGIHLEQQFGVKGISRGPGETAKEKEIRHLKNQILKIKKQLEKIEKSRKTQRKRRLISQIPHICLIGYTNAGKSTILNILTKSSVPAKDILFATLDTTTRELYINSKKIGIISDTVGFIQQLPHRLIEAFKSTLSELQYANLLLQIIDITDPNLENHIQIVHEILKELNIDKEMLYVFNKSDKLKDNKETLKSIKKYQPQVIISAISKKGIQPLIDYLNNWNPKT